MDSNDMTALITGASSGLGEEFAKQLASQGYNLVLVARSEGKMNQLAETLRQSEKVQVAVIAADLASSEAVARVVDEVNRRNIRVDLLVNNAGLDLFENFHGHAPAGTDAASGCECACSGATDACVHAENGTSPPRWRDQHRVQRSFSAIGQR